MKTILEVCVDSYASAMAAVAGGANGWSCAAACWWGGLTPDVALLEQIREKTDIPIRCLMRPRFGDFLYDESEIQLMETQIRRLAAAGADGFVIGCLTPAGELDLGRMARLIAAAGGRGVTLHRAFDVCRDGLTAARQAVELGGGYHPHQRPGRRLLDGPGLSEPPACGKPTGYGYGRGRGERRSDPSAVGPAPVCLPHERQNHGKQRHDLPAGGGTHGPARAG